MGLSTQNGGQRISFSMRSIIWLQYDENVRGLVSVLMRVLSVQAKSRVTPRASPVSAGQSMSKDTFASCLEMSQFLLQSAASAVGHAAQHAVADVSPHHPHSRLHCES